MELPRGRVIPRRKFLHTRIRLRLRLRLQGYTGRRVGVVKLGECLALYSLGINLKAVGDLMPVSPPHFIKNSLETFALDEPAPIVARSCGSLFHLLPVGKQQNFWVGRYLPEGHALYRRGTPSESCISGCRALLNF